MKKFLILCVLHISVLAHSQSSGNTDKLKTQKIIEISFSIDSLIKSELGNLKVKHEFDSICHDMAQKYILKQDDQKYNGIHWKFVSSISFNNNQLSYCDLPKNDIVEGVKQAISGRDLKDWEFTSYSVVFGEYAGKSYMVLGIDY